MNYRDYRLPLKQTKNEKENKPYKCESPTCNRKFDEKEFELTKDKNKCILHSKKNTSEYNDKIKEFFFVVLQKEDYKDAKYFDIYFPIFIKEINDFFDKKKDIFFKRCFFLGDVKFYKKVEAFDNCTFLGEVHIGPRDNDKNTYFKDCTFTNYIRNIKTNQKLEINGNIFERCTFSRDNIIEKENGICQLDISDCIFTDKIFTNIIKNLPSLVFSNCIFKSKFILQKSEVKELYFLDSIFENKVKIQSCIINDIDFYNTKFQDLADFYQTEFKKVNFERTDFEKISVFSEVVFDCEVNFKYTKFLGKSIFRDTVIKENYELNLRDSIFDAEANFLDISSVERVGDSEPKDITVANRETARIIKNFYDNSNNVIEANHFYKLEMKEREKELDEDKKNGKNLFEWLIFKIHGMTSNHSQDWTVALFWIISIGLFGSLYNFYSKDNFVNFSFTSMLGTLLLILIAILLNYIFKPSKKIEYGFLLFNFYLIYGYKTGDILLSNFAKNLNPFSIMDVDYSITLGTLVFKIIIAYLIYQLIISIRQNTRRK